jgi:hypothetical protein
VPLPWKVGQSVGVERASLSIDAVHYVRPVNFSLGSRATFELRPLFVCSTLTLLTESLQRRIDLAIKLIREETANGLHSMARQGWRLDNRAPHFLAFDAKRSI